MRTLSDAPHGLDGSEYYKTGVISGIIINGNEMENRTIILCHGLALIRGSYIINRLEPK